MMNLLKMRKMIRVMERRLMMSLAFLAHLWSKKSIQTTYQSLGLASRTSLWLIMTRYARMFCFSKTPQRVSRESLSVKGRRYRLVTLIIVALAQMRSASDSQKKPKASFDSEALSRNRMKAAVAVDSSQCGPANSSMISTIQ